LGGSDELTADVRVIAATGQDLQVASQEAVFRPDLYYRLRVLSVEVPPLRKRREDIPLLANYFRVTQSALQKRRVLGITAAARDCLMRYAWPGNVHELGCAIESAVAVGSTEGILPEDLPEAVLPAAGAPDDLVPRYHREVHDAKCQLVLKAYRQAGSHGRAAALLGLHPHSLARLVRTLDLQAAIENLGGERVGN
jgi:DNA-binding NtrC family response regulator